MADFWPSQPGDFKNQHLLPRPWQQVVARIKYFYSKCLKVTFTSSVLMPSSFLCELIHNLILIDILSINTISMSFSAILIIFTSPTVSIDERYLTI